MDRFTETEHRFKQCLQRSRDICALQGFLTGQYTQALDSTDLLRASVVLCVSAYDFLIHELFRIEAGFRLAHKKEVKKLQVPFLATVCDEVDVHSIVETHIKNLNSHRSFVDPGKYAELMSGLIDEPWTKVSHELGQDKESLKIRVRAVYRWRNRISHEADINPDLAGVELFPINPGDVRDAVDDFEKIGLASLQVIRNSSHP